MAWLFRNPMEISAQKNSNDRHLVLSLNQAIELALQNNRALAGSVYARENAALSLEAALSEFDVKWAPSAGVGISREEETTRQLGTGVILFKTFEFGAKASIGPELDFSEDDYSGGIGFSLSVPLLKGFGKAVTLDPVYSAEQGVKNALRSLHLSRVATVIDTVSSVYSILQQQELIRLFETQVGVLETQARLAMAKERAGLATSMDIYRAEIRTRDAQESLNRAREALKSVEDRLKLILALPPEKHLKVTASRNAEPADIGEEEAFAVALENRVEIDHAKDAVDESRRQAEIAKDRIKPGLDMILKYRLFSEPETYSRAIQLDENTWSINLVSTTDWSRKAEKAAYQQRSNAVKTAEIQLQSREDQIKEEVRRQLEALNKSNERIQIRKEQIHQAEGKLALSRIKFRYNLAGNFDLIEAATELQQAEVDHLAAQIDYIVGTYRLRAVLGTLIQRPAGI